MRDVVILGAVRTPIGRFLGGLASVPAPQLGAVAIRGALDRAGVRPDQVNEVIMGNVLSAGLGQAPARQAALAAGIPETVPATTINKMCGSSLKAVMLAAQAIQSGDAEVVVAGGMESMSLAPYLLERARTGYRIGDGAIVDSILRDGLVDAYKQIHMGSCCELLNREYRFTRQEQDAYAIQSYRRALDAMSEGKFAAEVVSVEVPQPRNGTALVEEDEEPRRVNFEKIPSLPPAFELDGTVTAANSSSISDGAAAVIVAAEEAARRLGTRPLARIVGQAGAAGAPEWFTVQPAAAIRRLLDRVGWTLADVDLIEINEAYASVVLAAMRDLGISTERVNIHGGAVALGHPIGASGARILATLLHALPEVGGRRGVAAICLGGGEAVALAVERV
ncbi:MAG: acetyl-CoA C-acyltransferase [Armatimonadetes bacterium]|nr:acetyl-CoA C-acyltransferase [Armatimonadota bacterium]